MARRKACGLSISAAADTAKINRNTWSSIEAGVRDTEDYIYGRVEQALGWLPGSIDRILAGGKPTIDEGFNPRQTQDRLRDERARFEQKELRPPEEEANLASYEVRLAQIVDDAERPDWMRQLARTQLVQIRDQLRQARALLDADSSYLAAEKNRRSTG